MAKTYIIETEVQEGRAKKKIQTGLKEEYNKRKQGDEESHIERMILEPKEIIQEMFDIVFQGQPEKPTTEQIATFNREVSEYFEEMLWENGRKTYIYKKIQTIQHKDKKEQGLVRCRCMIQDIFGNIDYCGPCVTRERHTGKYKCNLYNDEIEIDDEENEQKKGNETVLIERLILYGVPIPGETPWKRREHQMEEDTTLIQKYNQKINEIEGKPLAKKRKREEDDLMMIDLESRVKVLGDDQNTMMMDEEEIHEEEEEEIQPYPLRKLKKKHDEKEETSSFTNKLCAPHIEDGQQVTPCLIKIYGTGSIPLRVQDIGEFVGIYSIQGTPFNQIIATMPEEEVLKRFLQEKATLLAQHPPQSLVPRLHCLFYRGNPQMEEPVNNPMTLFVEPKIHQPPTMNFLLEQHEKLYAYLYRHVCFGDPLAASYMQCHLLSKLFKRENGGLMGHLPVGPLHLGLQGLLPNDVALLMERIKPLVGNLVKVNMEEKALNNQRWAPQYDDEQSKLLAGQLQLPSHTFFMVDETKFTGGKLTAKALKNVEALRQVLVEGQLTYDYAFNTAVRIPTSLSVLYLMGDAKPFVKQNVIVLPIRKRQTPPLSLPDDQFFNSLRIYLEYIKYHHSFTLLGTDESKMSNYLTQQFIQRRAAHGAASYDNDAYGRDLLIGRYLSMAKGIHQLTTDMYQQALYMENARRDRMHI